MSPDEALRRLHISGRRYTVSTEGQYPFAAVLSCSDSRVVPELIFDCAPGELFVVRTAGNTADAIAIGSLEFAVTVLGVPLILVLGHTHCGAVEAKASGSPYGSFMAAVMAEVRPCADENILHTIFKLEKSPVLSGLVGEGKLIIAGAKFTLETGCVTFVS
ncbi:MAG: carbonic anhydrase [Oscillospiraceae bacterium]|nr:carbonic anhydrase [Oscillospiraceae bacterium]